VTVKVHAWPGFEKAIDKLERKYPNIKADVADAFSRAQSIEELAARFKALPGYSHKLWKFRIASRDMGRGTRGGFRVIFYMNREARPDEAHLLTIYAKSERADVPPDELLRLWKRFWEYFTGARQGGSQG
jgi:mRNA-degrading endonuclease RelE of RelBE toxin-antitoxin system